MFSSNLSRRRNNETLVTYSNISHNDNNMKFKSIFTPIEKNDFEALKEIVSLEPRQIRRKTEDTRNTPLMEASRRGRLKMVKYLIEKRAKVYHRSAIGNTALIEAAFGGHSNVCEYLLQNGSNIDEQNKYGFSPLMSAAFHGHEKCVKTLIKYRPRINLRNNDGRTALSLSLFRSNHSISVFLKMHGATE